MTYSIATRAEQVILERDRASINLIYGTSTITSGIPTECNDSGKTNLIEKPHLYKNTYR